MHTTMPPAPDRVVWVIHQPGFDRRSGKLLSLDDVRHLGRPRVVLPQMDTATNYEPSFAQMRDAWEDFVDGDVVLSMGGDLHTLTMVDDVLRQLGVRWYVWAKHVGGGRYIEVAKMLDRTHIADADTAVGTTLTTPET